MAAGSNPQSPGPLTAVDLEELLVDLFGMLSSSATGTAQHCVELRGPTGPFNVDPVSSDALLGGTLGFCTNKRGLAIKPNANPTLRHLHNQSGYRHLFASEEARAWGAI